MKSQPGQEKIEIHTLTNISRGKDNKAIEFGQLIEYNMRNMKYIETKLLTTCFVPNIKYF